MIDPASPSILRDSSYRYGGQEAMADKAPERQVRGSEIKGWAPDKIVLGSSPANTDGG